MSLLAPLLFGGFIFLMAYFGAKGDENAKYIAVLDGSQYFIHKMPETESLRFEYKSVSQLDSLKKALKGSKYYGILVIDTTQKADSYDIKFYSYSQPGISVVQPITSTIERELRDKKLKKYNIENIDLILKSVETHIDLQTIKLSESGIEKKGSTETAMGIAYIGSLLIYMFILLYGVQVMRGVIEEKTNRIVEVVISSVKPFQLMMGKVLGVALTALTQFFLWIIFTYIIVNFTKQGLQSNPAVIQIFSALGSINYAKIIGYFIFYFITGYLLYSSLFAAVGAAVDNEADTQQFVFPVTLPLIVGIMIMIQAFRYPDGIVPVWGSIIPFTAPIVMMARIPYEPPWQEIALSMSLMVITFIATIWFAAKIYRIGILMYGKKVNLKELIKWLRYKN